MRIGIVQLTSGGDIVDNLALARDQIREAASRGATLIVLPEAASHAFGAGRLDSQAQELDGLYATGLRELARELGVTVVAGMFRPADTVEREGRAFHRVYNTALVTGPDVHLGYDKIHTFDAFDYRESDTVKPGSELVTFEVDGVTVGVATCYDIRFPVQFQDLARRGAQVIVVPTSWMDGPEKLYQWRTLTAARALDSTSWIVAAGQARPGGQEQAGQSSGPTGIGHSCVVGPTGRREAEAGYEPEIIVMDLDMDEVTKARKTLPVL
ncbi:carbon-nitrogen hydrolase family protein [Corynebacterium hylobatis]|uniref:Carbon-nitrogen hydrolase family protein n=1 Tax=Corynebacterium hylobatis TaxID=1859290 RepID=A0A3S0HID0_9CORY|nr:carbon-nitrogen hydrolase family protein [Corynebacterium hylobatis]RSZ64657.1 carbon-nitrogen hydrolase family protein [Corynebacterium hylobatis]